MPRLRQSGSRQTVLALALLAAFDQAQAQAQTSEAQAQTSEAQGSVSFGLGAVSGNSADRALFGQYNGVRTGGVIGLLGVEYSRRDPATGTSTEFEASNLLGDNRELGLRWKKQGDWKFFADYGEGIRREPNTINTGLLGAGTTQPQVVPLAGGPGTGSDLDLKLKRKSLGLAFSKVISPSLQFDISAKSENKEGARLFGSGFSCPSSVAPGCRGSTGTETGSAVLMLPEPVNANHTQVEARLSYAGQKLRLSGGYYGSFYSNANGSLNPGIPSSLNNSVGTLLPLSTGLQSILSQPLALPPDNQAHHLDIAGSYAFTRTTQANFKLGYSQATQQQDFASAGLTGAPAGVANLGGKVTTTLAQIGITSRPTPKLSLLANFRYEDRDDETPIALYNIEGTSTYTNRRLPQTKVRGKLQASYQFSSDYRGTVGADVESIDRGVFTSTSAIAGTSALRQKTDETGVRAELRRAMSENFSAAISVASSRRDGSNWLKDNSGRGVTEVTDPADPNTGFGPSAIFMPRLANRQRDKVRLLADWQPTERLSLQFSAEDGKDRFMTPNEQGLRSTGMNLFNIDWDFALSDKWSLNGYLSQGNQRLHQTRPAGYILSFDNTGTYLGLGVAGKPNAKIEVGGGLSFANDTSVYAQTLAATADAGSVALLAATGGLPDIVFRQTTLKLFGKYALDKRSAVRLDLLYQRSQWNDWTWGYNGVPFTYSDGTTVSQKPTQNVGFVGVTYTYRWP